MVESAPNSACDSSQQTSLDRKFGPGMFWLTIVWLALVGGGLHLLNDPAAHVVSEDEATASTSDVVADELDAPRPGRFEQPAMTCLLLAFGLLPFYWAEWLTHRWSADGGTSRHLVAALFPPLRIGARDHVDGRTLWLPGTGWMTATDDLEVQLERKLGVPMIVVALLVLPVIAIEFVWAERIVEEAWLAVATQLAGAAIWLAFSVEFLVLISIVKDRWRFVRRHWLDLLIICLPLLAFLRVLRLGRLGRLLRLNQLTKVSRSARAFRLKGLALRVWRALLVLEIVDRTLNRDDQKRLSKLQAKLADAEREVQSLLTEIRSLEAKLDVAGKSAAVEAEGDEIGTRQSA